MGSKLHGFVALAVIFLAVGFVNSNIDQDRAECTDQVVGLATCLPYVGGDAKAPTPDCCGGLKLVLQKSKKCLCILIKDRNDPSIGLKINLTLALGLPTACHVPTNISECIDILHLPPNSREAKEFHGFDQNVKGGSGNTTSSASPTVSGNPDKSEGGMRRKSIRFRVEMLIWFFSSCVVVLTQLTHN